MQMTRPGTNVWILVAFVVGILVILAVMGAIAYT